MNGNERIRKFEIKAECIRFFDKEGDFLEADSLPKGEVYSYSPSDFIPISEGYLSNEKVGGLVCTYFDFQEGDIIRLPDGKPIIIGKKLEEGMRPRSLVANAYALDGENLIPIYRAFPSIFVKMKSSQADGTLIKINDQILRMFDVSTVSDIELGDRSGEKGFLLDLSEAGYTSEGIYEVIIDVPNDRTNRYWKFALINNMEYCFEDSLYVYKSRGTISFNNFLDIVPEGNNTEKVSEEKIFNFEIDGNNNKLYFRVKTQTSEIRLFVKIPMLAWSFDINTSWQLFKPSEIWHSDLPTKIFFSCPTEKLKLILEDQASDEENEWERVITYQKLKEKDIFECDITRFKSWFDREQEVQSIYLEFDNKRYPFIDVVTKSIIKSAIIKSDFDKNLLIGDFEIVVKANYYADVEFAGRTIASKIPLYNMKFEVNSVLQSGKYKITLFEDEEDDTGFGYSNYLTIAVYERDLLNPQNLEGKSLKIERIIDRSSMFALQLRCTYKVINLKFVNQDDPHKYRGVMVVENSLGKILTDFPVYIQFYDLEKLNHTYITFIEDDECLEFLYDEKREIIVKDPERGLTRAEEYRRYKRSLYPEDYIFVVNFAEESGDIKQPFSKKDYKDPTSLTLDENIKKTINHNADSEVAATSEFNILATSVTKIGLPALTYNCLIKAKLLTVGDIKNLIDKKGIKALNSVNKLNANMQKQVIDSLRKIGLF
ncbi:MAG: hypothetical protein ACOX1Y_06035 [Zhaonellaceae bacterium]